MPLIPVNAELPRMRRVFEISGLSGVGTTYVSCTAAQCGNVALFLFDETGHAQASQVVAKYNVPIDISSHSLRGAMPLPEVDDATTLKGIIQRNKAAGRQMLDTFFAEYDEALKTFKTIVVDRVHTLVDAARFASFGDLRPPLKSNNSGVYYRDQREYGEPNKELEMRLFRPAISATNKTYEQGCNVIFITRATAQADDKRNEIVGVPPAPKKVTMLDHTCHIRFVIYKKADDTYAVRVVKSGAYGMEGVDLPRESFVQIMSDLSQKPADYWTRGYTK